MRTPPRRAARVALAGAVVAALAAAGGVAHAGRSGSGAGTAALAVVVVRAPSVADRVAARGGPTSEAEQRGWSAAAFHAQEDVLARLARAGQPLQPLSRLTRALDGFVARVDPAQALLLERDPAVEGVHPLRALRAVAASPVERAAGRPSGIDASWVGVARIGREAATSGALLAAIETALDPSGDGDTHDAARVIALDVTDPLAARFPGSPVARALAGAQALGAVVVTMTAADVAATVVAARPGLTAATVAALLRQAAAPWPGGPPDLAAALAAEVVAEAPVGGAPGLLVLRNSSSRPVRVRVAGRAGVAVLPAVATLAAGATLAVVVSTSAAAPAAAAPAAAARARPRAATAMLDVTPDGGASFRVAVPLPARATGAATAAGAPTLRLAPGAATPSDARPARLTVLLPAATERLEVELLRGGVLLGTLVRLRELLPGRYVLALTGRGPAGARLAAGSYVVRVVAALPAGAPSHGGGRPAPAASRSVQWAIRSLK